VDTTLISHAREVPNFFLNEDSGDEHELPGQTGPFQHWDEILALVTLTRSNVPIVISQKLGSRFSFKFAMQTRNNSSHCCIKPAPQFLVLRICHSLARSKANDKVSGAAWSSSLIKVSAAIPALFRAPT
jgi:hypothetical protein